METPARATSRHPPARRISLLTTEDSWLVAAPEKCISKDVSAVTASSYLPRILHIHNTPSPPVPSSPQEQRPPQYTSFDPRGRGRQTDDLPPLPKIQLVDVLPKESERQRQLQQQQLDLERTQEIADRLFNDPGAARSGRKRGAGGMRAYLTQSTAKKGRGQR